MGMITSDFYSRFDKIDIVESPFTVEELMNLASVDTQAQFAAWTAENGDTSYIPAAGLSLSRSAVLSTAENTSF